MATINFYLKDPKSTKETLLYLFFSFDNSRLKVSTGETIKPKDWNFNEQRAKRSLENYSAFNGNLDKLEEDYKKAYRLLLSSGANVTSESIRKKIAENKVKSDNNSSSGLIAYVREFITRTQGLVTHGTTKNYMTTLSVLERFQNKRNRRIDFDSVDLNFYEQYVKFQTQDLGYTANTVGKNVKNLKVFLADAAERGLNKNFEFRKKGFKVFKEDIDNIYLNAEELRILEKTEIELESLQDRVRDLFLVGCYTGLRFSDFTHIKKENIKNGLITLRTKKTNEVVSIPVHPVVKNILNKYRGKTPNSLPSPVANQVMNRSLKEIGEKIGFHDKVIIKKTIGGKRTENKYFKYDLISTHTARRSFATNLFLQGFLSISIMKITGHRTEKAFMQYIKMSPEENAMKLKDHWKRTAKN